MSDINNLITLAGFFVLISTTIWNMLNFGGRIREEKVEREKDTVLLREEINKIRNHSDSLAFRLEHMGLSIARIEEFTKNINEKVDRLVRDSEK